MRYGSVCSGIEAASFAWHGLGWEPQWFSEIEHFPSAVLNHRFPNVPNLGDMTQLTSNPIANERPIDLLVGGTPCQSFSVAGLRKGLADPRGNLMLTFLALADAKKPKWIVWENVPGVLSSNGGKDFGTFLGALGELGYGFAYRVLDAQHFGVAQRRRRVFVVGYLGDWRVAAAVLFERESLQGNTKPSRKKRQEVTSDAEGSVGEASQVVIDRAAFNQGENAQYEPRIEEGEMMSSLVAKGPHAVAQPIPIHDQATRFNGKRGNKQDGKGNGLGIGQEYDPSPTLTKGDRHAVAQPIAFEPGKMQRLGYGYSDNGTSPTLRSEPGDNQLAVAQPIAVDWRTAQVDQGITQTLKTDLAKMSGPCVAVDVYNQSIDGQTSATITEAVGGTNTSGPKVMQPMAFPINTENMFEGSTSYGRTVGENNEPSFALTKAHSHAVGTNMAIRRLTPKECERLQGFPDDWTKIPYRNKPADQCPDGPRYKACGNSMAVPVMRWIGERIKLIESML